MRMSNAIIIWGVLDYVGLDAEGNIHFYIRKKSNVNSLLDKLSRLIGRNVIINIQEGLPWVGRSRA